MSRPTKSARLWYRKPSAKSVKKGKASVEAGGWVILDNGKQYRTGCGKNDIKGAEDALKQYLAKNHKPTRKQRHISEIPVSDVINLYARERVPKLATAAATIVRLDRLNEWFGAMMLEDINGAACRAYAANRGHTGVAARRELSDLSAAIGFHLKEGLHREIVKVTMPDAGSPRERWLTRDEVARLLRVCLHYHALRDNGPIDRFPLKHVARFVLFCLYTGSRPGDALNTSFVAAPNCGRIDIDAGLYFRKPAGKIETKKRQPTTPLPPRLLAHLRRWRRLGASAVVEWLGEPSHRMRYAFRHAVELAGLGDDVVPYTLRHTAATWMLQNGVSTWVVAGYLGTSEAMIRKHYGHHCPDHLRDAIAGISHNGLRNGFDARNETQRNKTDEPEGDDMR